jgi:two-component system, LytTR family, response regulator
MSEVRTLIVDDEPLARRGIRQLLASHPDFAVLGECRDGREALRSLVTLQPDLVFLDIQMPGLDGLGVIRQHGPERMPLVIFVTAHDQFAVQAFEAQALDYLVKPLSQKRFDAAIARVRDHLRKVDAVTLAARLRALLAGSTATVSTSDRSGSRIAVPTGNGERLLEAHEIDWIEADDYYVRIHSGGLDFRLRESLSALESRLDPERFLRIHRTAIVRLDQVRELRTDPGLEGEAVLLLRDGTRLPVSRRRLPGVRARLRTLAGPA